MTDGYDLPDDEGEAIQVDDDRTASDKLSDALQGLMASILGISTVDAAMSDMPTGRGRREPSLHSRQIASYVADLHAGFLAEGFRHQDALRLAEGMATTLMMDALQGRKGEE